MQALVKSLAGQATGQPDNQLKLDYCVFNAGVLQYPGVSLVTWLVLASMSSAN
jgi:hypothetical protein